MEFKDAQEKQAVVYRKILIETQWNLKIPATADAAPPMTILIESQWNLKKNIISEAFAHMFEAQFDEKRYNEMKKYFPQSLEYFEKKLRGRLK